jgi:DNA-binding transcriptional MerR regulator
MTAFTIQEVSWRSGLSEPTLRYYEEVGLVGPMDRDENSGHRRYSAEDLHTLGALACLRATGVGIEDMRTVLSTNCCPSLPTTLDVSVVANNDLDTGYELGIRPTTDEKVRGSSPFGPTYNRAPGRLFRAMGVSRSPPSE